MKKLLCTLAIVAGLIVGIFSVSASAERMTTLPITMLTQGYYSETYYTLTGCDIYVYSNADEQLYTNSVEIYLDGSFNSGSRMDLAFNFYDASGNYLTTKYDTINSDEHEYGAYFHFVVPDVTAFVEIGAKNPYSWSHTYFYNKYRNVYSDDGRVLGIPEMLLPVYESVGWHGDVWMYALNGESMEVPYNQIAAYQRVGWYLWNDYIYHTFQRDYNSYLKSGDYSAAFSELEYALSSLEGTAYANELYGRKTKLMDAWRKKINGPLAVTNEYIYDGSATIYFRNVSYKTVKAFKLQFDCYDIFNTKLTTYSDYYYTDSAWISSSDSKSFKWSGLPSKTHHLGNVRVTQVVYSDDTYWYR